MTAEVILHLMKCLQHYVGIFFYQNHLINECARNSLAKTPESGSFFCEI